MNFNVSQAIEYLIDFINEKTREAGFKKVVLGISGGIDSALVAFLSVKSLGKDNVTGLLMPYRESSKKNIQDAWKISRILGIDLYNMEITSQIDKYFENFPEADKNRRGNKMARERMSILYDVSAKENTLVIGTSNKSEILLGYGTIYGDIACAINPIGDFYKTQVKMLAKEIGVPEEIINKIPSADLYEGQTDEEELGYSYKEIDEILYFLMDNMGNINSENCIIQGYKRTMVEDIVARIEKNRFKSRLPIVATYFGFVE